MITKLSLLLLILMVLQVVVAPPVDSKKKEKDDKKEKSEELDDFGLEYGRYLQQIVQALEEDKEFAKKLENISAEDIRNGKIAKELEFVKHNVRSKLDELKRIEVDRLRKLLQEQMERTELGLYRDEDGHLLNSPDGRRWRTIPNHRSGLEGGVGDGNFWLGLDRKGVKIPKHLDIENPHSFEIEDLKKLIQTATNDLEEIDRQRREEFKNYELEKEAKYRESLKNMTEDQKKETEKHHQEMLEKHKDHPKIHHPGSKPQLEQVWEDQDHMPKEEFNPRTFFAFHDVNGDGFLDVEEVEAILLPEVKKLYNPNNEEDDPIEMEEEFHRMREHIFNETDTNKDHLISLEEFLKMTEQQEFQRDEGWKGLDEQQVYSEAELQEYLRQRQMEMHQQGYPYGDQRYYYDVGNAQQGPHGGVPPQPGYPHGQQYGVPPQAGYPQQHAPAGHQQFQGAPQQQYQAGYPQHQQFQGVPPQQFQDGHPQQQFHGVPQQQFQAGHPQQPQGGHQQQFQGGHPQQPQGGHPQQQFQGGHPQQLQGGHPQQLQGGHPQQLQGGHPQQPQGGHQQPQFQGVPQQQFQAGHQQPQGGQQQQFQAGQQQQFQAAQPQQQAKVAQQGNQPLNSVPSQQVPDQKQTADQSNSINQIPNADGKHNVPQDSAPHASSQQVPKIQS